MYTRAPGPERVFEGLASLPKKVYANDSKPLSVTLKPCWGGTPPALVNQDPDTGRITRPILELVPRPAVRGPPGAYRLVMLAGSDPVPAAGEIKAGEIKAGEIKAGEIKAGEILGVDYAGDRVAVTLRATREAVLVYRDNTAPGWTARVDGEAAQLLVVDRLNKAVALPAGEHRVEFLYRPWAYLVTFALRTVVLSVIGVACLVLLLRRRPSIVSSQAPNRSVSSR